MSSAQVNRDMVATIATLQQEVVRAKAEAAKLEAEAKVSSYNRLVGRLSGQATFHAALRACQ
jgi:hypothetical protein